MPARRDALHAQREIGIEKDGAEVRCQLPCAGGKRLAFALAQESRVDDFGPLWAGWGGGFGWGRPWGGFGWGWGWGGWGPWGPYDETITHYTGQVLANLQGPAGYMRCHFTLERPYSSMAGGGIGQCQLPTGAVINAQFMPGAARYR